jgi:hypothetical protein
MGKTLRNFGSSKPPKPPPLASSRHDVETALDKAGDAHDRMKVLLRQLPDYDGDEEADTANHNVHVTVNLPPTASQPEIKLEGDVEVSVGPVRLKGLPKWATIAIGLVAAAIAALVAARFAK